MTLSSIDKDLASLGLDDSPLNSSSKKSPQQSSGEKSSSLAQPPKKTSNLSAPEVLKKTTTSNSPGESEEKPAATRAIPLPLSLDASIAHTVLASPATSHEQKLSVITRRNTNSAVSQQEIDANPTTAGAQQMTFSNKKDAPKGASVVMSLGTGSFTQSKKIPAPFAPSGSITSNPKLNGLYKEFIDSITKASDSSTNFLPVFTKLHLVALHQVYEYLMGIYASLNMTHVDDVEAYVSLEGIYGLNAKTLIINHLITVIEAQLNQALRALFPTMPREQATHAGMMCINSDKASRVDLLIVDIEQVIFQMFETGGITPEQWTSVLAGLTNRDHTPFLQKLSNQTLLLSVTKKINSFLNTSMDLGGSNAYEKEARTTFEREPQKSLFGGTIPSALVWQQKMDAVISTTSDSAKIPAYISLGQQLSKEERVTLIDALDLLVAHFSSSQRTQDVTTVLKMLSGALPEAPLSIGQYTLVSDIVKTLAFTGPLDQQITLIKQIYADLVSANPTPLTDAQKETLNSIVAYATLRLEKDTTSAINETVGKIQTILRTQLSALSAKEKDIFARLDGLTALEQGQLRIISEELLTEDGKLADSVAFERLEDRDKVLLAKGLADYAKTQTALSPAQRSLVEEVSARFTAGTFNLSALSEVQRTAYTATLTALKAFHQDTYTYQQAEQDMYTLFDKAKFDKVTETLNADDPNLFSKYSAPELLMLLGSFQGAGRVVESRIHRHEEQAALLTHLFETEPMLQRQLYWALGSNEYGHLIGIGNLIDTQAGPDKEHMPNTDETLYVQAEALDSLVNPEAATPTGVSLAGISPKKRLILADILALFVAPEKGKKLPALFPDNPADARSGATMQSGLLEMIRDVHMQDPLVAQLSQINKAQNYEFMQTLFKQVSRSDFELKYLTSEQKQFLKTLLEGYQDIITKSDGGAQEHTPSSETETKGLGGPTHPLSDEDHININGVATILHAYTHISETQQSFLKSLGLYLNFFTPYTATLKQKADEKTGGQGLTAFAHYAQSIAKTLEGTPMGNINPPLFFYDVETLRSIKLLPYLAHSVEGTINAPFPTFGVNAALSLNPLSANPQENNQVQLDNGSPLVVPSLIIFGQGPTYSPRFFFKDQYGKPIANNSQLQFGQKQTKDPKKEFSQEVSKNQTLPWLEKRTIPSQNSITSFPFIFTPTQGADGSRIKTKGEEGLFTNIPVISRDPARKDGILVRLYEQPLLGQPDWLNSQEGVVTMLQVCLGDFASGLILDEKIFDPTLHFIFKKAIKVTKIPEGISSQSLDLSDQSMKQLEQGCNLHLIHEHLDLSGRETMTEQLSKEANQ